MATFTQTALDPNPSPAVVRRAFYRFSLSLSLLYLALVFEAVFAAAIGPRGQQMDSLQKSNLWLGPIQGLVATALGALFVSKKHSAKDDDGTPSKDV